MSSVFDNVVFSGGETFAPEDGIFAIDYSEVTPAVAALNSSNTVQSPIQPETVSPQELMNNTFALSTTSSVAFPPLDTPDSANWHNMPSSLDTSPMDNLLDSANLDEYAAQPLFPQDGSDFYGQLTSTAMAPTDSFHSAYTESTNQSNPSPMVRQKSSPGRPPTIGLGHARKHSSTAGVKPSKARKPLDPIVIGQDDSKEDAKRKKNTAAARKSRQRRQETLEALSAENARLRALVESLGGDPREESFTPEI